MKIFYKILIRTYCNIKLFLSPFKSKIKIIKNDEMINYVIKNKLSIIRYGDGEFRIMNHRKWIHYQCFNQKLCKEMNELFYNYSCKSKYLLSVPYFFNEDIKWYKNMPYSFTACFAECRLFFRKKHIKNMVYGGAFLFRKWNMNIYEKLWENEKELILIHNDIKRAQALECKYKIKVKFIEIPKKNAYNEIDNIEKKIEELNKDNSKILISAGPMAKALIYRLSEKYTIYDTGHCFDEPLKI